MEAPWLLHMEPTSSLPPSLVPIPTANVHIVIDGTHQPPPSSAYLLKSNRNSIQLKSLYNLPKLMDFISSTLLWLSRRPIHLRFIWQQCVFHRPSSSSQHSHTRPCLCPPLAIANWLWDLWVYCVHVLCPRLFVASAPLPVNHFHKSIPFWMSHPQITIQRGPPAAVVTVPLKVFPKRIRRRRNNNKFQFMSQNVLHVPLTSTPPLHVIVIIFYTTMITNHHPRGGRVSRGWHSRHHPPWPPKNNQGDH